MTKEQRIAEMAKEIYKYVESEGVDKCYVLANPSDVVLGFSHNWRIAKSLVEKGYGNIKQAEAEIERLREELSHREEDLVHTDENVFYRECNVALHEKEIKKQAVEEFAERLKRQCEINSDSVGGCGGYCVSPFEIDNLLKEYLDD